MFDSIGSLLLQAQQIAPVLLPLVTGGPATVQPVMITTQPAAASAYTQTVGGGCFNELEPVNAAQVSTFCPRAGLVVPALVSGGETVIFGWDNEPTAWVSDTPQQVTQPQQIRQVAGVEFGSSITNPDGFTPGVAVGDAPYTVLQLPTSYEDVQVATVQTLTPFQQAVDRGLALAEAIRGDGQGQPWLEVGEDELFYSPLGTRITPRLKGCWEPGKLVVWVATGPARMIFDPVTGAARIGFKGMFPGAEMRACMGEYVYRDVASVWLVPELAQRAAPYLPGGARYRAPLVWPVQGGGIADRSIGWAWWDNLWMFGVRVKQGATWVTTMYLVVPTDLMRMDCITVSDREYCTLEQQPSL